MNNNRRKKLIALIACASLLLIAVIGLAECKEYTDLACTFKTPVTADYQNTTARAMDWKEAHQWMLPHMTGMVYSIAVDGKVWIMQCGGTLISNKFILAVAQCVQHADITDVYVTVGGLNLYEYSTNLNVTPKKVHFHPEYLGDKFRYNICLIELEAEVKFSSNVRPICLNTKFEKYYDSVIVSRWQLGELFNHFSQMMESSLDKKTEEYCRSELGDEYSVVEETGICLTNLPKRLGEYGSIGNPLQIKLNSKCENTWEQLGISLIYSDSLVYPDNLTVQLFTRVDLYVDWIVSVVWPD